MVERKRVGILFNYSEGWIGGTYYFLNLVKALLQLHDTLKPTIVILTNDVSSFKKIQETGYPYLICLKAHFNYTLIERALNKLSHIITKKSLVVKQYSKEALPVLFGYYEQLPFYKCRRKLYWIPDLQDCYYPQYVGKEVAEARKTQHLKLADSSHEVVFSSGSARQDFEKFYSNSKCVKHVMHFAVTIPALQDACISELLLKYDLPDNYYFAPNQFWPHKNHFTVIKAIEFLKQTGKEHIVVFTGNENTGNGDYVKELKLYVSNNNLQNQVRFLGFIDRDDQLLLMKNSRAVIQASLFEGWSTVIEDAKALNKFLIVSDLTVHREQLNKNVLFFETENYIQLAELINTEIFPMTSLNNYAYDIENFAESFLNIINS